ncbi:hypothetical protein ABZ897_12575 [Nonomuraea sp. NPDC046802]|uniref:hypothetical protein n=1 Tax=Nonomuraea sp. NPDC046802 TaxID=3154919 RepID=UPI0033EC3356
MGPMALLAALSLLLSVCWNPAGAIGVAMAAWSLSALAVTDIPVPPAYRLVWTSGPWTLALAALLGAAAIVLAGRGEPIRRSGATHPS